MYAVETEEKQPRDFLRSVRALCHDRGLSVSRFEGGAVIFDANNTSFGGEAVSIDYSDEAIEACCNAVARRSRLYRWLQANG